MLGKKPKRIERTGKGTESENVKCRNPQEEKQIKGLRTSS
jgi:hypothetical protein